MPDPLYTFENTRPAYQLRWSLALFARQTIPGVADWLESLNAVTERDGVRVLEHHGTSDSQFFVLSTQPHVAPPQIVKSVKGRLQHLIQKHSPNAFRRNFRLTSIGSANREATEKYVAGQLGHHRMADPGARRILEDFQFEFPDVDLRSPQRSAHGEYLYNLHVVLVHDNRWNEVRRDRLQVTSDMIARCAQTKNHRLSRVAILSDHVHLTMGVPYDVTPGNVALGYMNNIAFAHRMSDQFRPSYYVGTFGEFDMDAVRRS